MKDKSLSDFSNKFLSCRLGKSTKPNIEKSQMISDDGDEFSDLLNFFFNFSDI